MPEPLVRAHATLIRGAAAFGRRQLIGSDHLRARVTGNGLRELDRFLNVLLDEASVTRGGRAAPALHNTANKFAWLRPDRIGDHQRLRALGRSRQCLFYYGGVVARADIPGGAELTIGWWDDEASESVRRLRRVGIGNRLALCDSDLREVGAYYARLANELADCPEESPSSSAAQPAPSTALL